VFQEEVDCEAIYQELVARYPRTGRLEQLFLPVGGKTRADFLEGVITMPGGEGWGGPPLRRTPCTGRLSLQGLRQQLLSKLQTKLEVLREEESCLSLEWSLFTERCRSLESGLELVARTYEIDKFRLQMVELGKIVSLLLSLSGRLVKVENALLSLDWNGVEEREELEGRRTKLTAQLDEAIALKVAIDRRSSTVADYVESYLGAEERERFLEVVTTKVRLMVEIREIQEKVRLGETQLAAVSQLEETNSANC